MGSYNKTNSMLLNLGEWMIEKLIKNQNDLSRRIVFISVIEFKSSFDCWPLCQPCFFNKKQIYIYSTNYKSAHIFSTIKTENRLILYIYKYTALVNNAYFFPTFSFFPSKNK